MRAFRLCATSVVALTAAVSVLTPQTAMGAPIPELPVGSSVDSLPPLQQDITPPLPAPLEQLGLTGIRLTAPYSQDAGQIRSTFGTAGSHDTASTIVSHECTSTFHRLYNLVLKYQQGVASPAPCWDTAPAGSDPIVGTQLIYPADIDSLESAPLIVLSPGIGVEPGMVSRQAALYASHGYVVSVGYSLANWFGYQVELAATAAIEANTKSGPLQGKIDSSNTVLVGHSAGGGSVMRVAEQLSDAMHTAGDTAFNVKGVVAINPGPADFGLASVPTTRPALILLAEHETLVPHPLSEMLYEQARGPKWLATVNGSLHGTYLDAPERSVYAGLVLSFAEYTLKGSPRAVAVYEGDGLAQDSELHDVQHAHS